MTVVIKIKGVGFLRNSACIYACNGKNLVIIFVSFPEFPHPILLFGYSGKYLINTQAVLEAKY